MVYPTNTAFQCKRTWKSQKFKQPFQCDFCACFLATIDMSSFIFEIARRKSDYRFINVLRVFVFAATTWKADYHFTC